MPRSLARDLKLLLIALTLAFTLGDILTIPFATFANAPAIDLQNLHAFQHCRSNHNPYLLTGAQCGDGQGRDMFYPPLLYFSFYWLRFVAFPFAATAWAGFLAAALMVCGWAWVPGRAWRNLGGVRIWLVLFALLLQYPSAFAIERGNCDILPLLGWAIAFRLWLAGRPGWSGFAAATAMALKLYPAFACVIVGAGVCGVGFRERKQLRTVLWFAAGGVVAACLPVLAFLPQTKAYLQDELPRFSRYQSPIDAFSHTLKVLETWHQGAFYVASALLASSWLYASVRYLKKDPALVFAGALAMSTYFANISYDYNLITSYPLLILLAMRALDGMGREALKNLLLSLFGMLVLLGGRTIVNTHAWYAGRVALQLAWLSSVALVGASTRDASTEWFSRSAPLRS